MCSYEKWEWLAFVSVALMPYKNIVYSHKIYL